MNSARFDPLPCTLGDTLNTLIKGTTEIQIVSVSGDPAAWFGRTLNPNAADAGDRNLKPPNKNRKP